MRNKKFVIVALLPLLGGCIGPLADSMPLTRADIDEITGDDTLTPQEQRAALAALGLSPAVINAILTDVRLGNQYGGDLRTAYEKIVNGHMDELTPDEVQIFGDEASDLDDTLDYTLEDDEAQAIVSFFVAQEIATKDDLLDFLDDPLSALSTPSDVPEGVLNDLFIDFDTDLLIDELP